MTETNPVAVFKTQNSERYKRYRVKRKMEVNQQQTPIDVELEIEKNARKLYIICMSHVFVSRTGCIFCRQIQCNMHMSAVRHP